MSDNMAPLLDKAYKLFERTPPAEPLDVCTHCCMTVDQERTLRSLPLTTIPRDLLQEYNDGAKTAQPPIEDIKYLAPRFLELVAAFQYPSHSVEISLQRFGYHEAADWTADELALLKEFQVTYFSRCLNTYPLPDRERLDSIVVMLWKMNLGIEHVLDEWLQHNELSAVLHLSDVVTHGLDIGRTTKMNNAFADDNLSKIVVSRLGSEPFITHFSPLLEKILLQPTDEQIDEQQLQELSWTYDMIRQLG